MIHVVADLCHHKAPFWGTAVFCRRRRIVSVENDCLGHLTPSPKKPFTFINI